MTLFVFSKISKKHYKNGENSENKNLDQFLTLELDQFLTLETPNLGPIFNSTAHIYIYIYIYISRQADLGTAFWAFSRGLVDCAQVNEWTALLFSREIRRFGREISRFVAVLAPSKKPFEHKHPFDMWCLASCWKTCVPNNTFCNRRSDDQRAKRYKNRGLEVGGRVRTVLSEDHCEARGANFFDFSKNYRKIVQRTFLSGKIRTSGIRIPGKNREIRENVARNGFRLLLGSALPTLIVLDCGPLGALLAKVHAICAL